MVQVVIINDFLEGLYGLIIDILKNLAGSLVWAVVAFVAVYFYNIFTNWFYKRKFYKSTRLKINPKQEKLSVQCFIANSGKYDENEKVYLGYPFEYMASASINSYLSLIIKNVDMSTTSCPLKVLEIEKVDKKERRKEGVKSA